MKECVCESELATDAVVDRFDTLRDLVRVNVERALTGDTGPAVSVMEGSIVSVGVNEGEAVAVKRGDVHRRSMVTMRLVEKGTNQIEAPSNPPPENPALLPIGNGQLLYPTILPVNGSRRITVSSL